MGVWKWMKMVYVPSYHCLRILKGTLWKSIEWSGEHYFRRGPNQESLLISAQVEGFEARDGLQGGLLLSVGSLVDHFRKPSNLYIPLSSLVAEWYGMIFAARRIGLVIGRLHEDEITFHACYHVRLTVFACRASKILMFNLFMVLPANQGQSLGTVLRGWWTCQFMSIQSFWHAEGFLRE